MKRPIKHLEVLATVGLLLWCAQAATAKLRLPDFTYYGTVRAAGSPVTSGTISVAVGDDSFVISSFTYPPSADANTPYVLAVPLDALDPQLPGTARTGDTARFYLDGLLIGTDVIGAQGAVKQLDLGADLPVLSAADLRIGVQGPDLVPAVFTLSLAQPSETEVKVDYATQDGTATAKQDYHAITGTARIAPGKLSTTVQVLVLGSGLGPKPESFALRLTNPRGAQLARQQALCVLTDDAMISAEGLVAREAPKSGATGQSIVLLPVRLSRPLQQAVTVDYQTGGGTAAEDQDYLPVSGTLSFAAGQTQQTISLTILDDFAYDPEETLIVGLSNPQGALLASPQATVTIADDERLLYDQMDRFSKTSIRSVFHTPNLAPYDAQAADDFTLAAQSTVKAVEVIGRFALDPGDAPRMRVQFYQVQPAVPGQTSSLEIPGNLLPVGGSQLVEADLLTNGSIPDLEPVRMVLPLEEPVELEAGSYWLSVQADMGNSRQNKWFWVYQAAAQDNPFVYRNPGNAYNEGCQSWSVAAECPGVPGQSLSFRLVGPAPPVVGNDFLWAAPLILLLQVLWLTSRRNPRNLHLGKVC